MSAVSRIGAQVSLTLAESLAQRENFSGSDRQRRGWDQFNQGYTAHMTGIMRDTYDSEATRVAREAVDIERIASKLRETLGEIGDDVEHQRITAAEGARQVGAVTRDLNKLDKARASAGGHRGAFLVPG